MIRPPIPKNEAQRLATLRALQLLDTPREERFDRITRLATSLFNVPIALITLVEEDRQWFKSYQGTTVNESSRDVSFCAYAILGNEVFVVSDATHDPRFSDNPLVKDDPWIRFYAGRPLFARDGSALGTLCILDRYPRLLTDSEVQMLQDLGAWVEQEINAFQINYEREIEHMKAQFVSHVSHELRTPLTVIQGYLELFLDGYLDPVSTSQREKLMLMQKSTQHLIALVENLLDIAQIDSGQIILQRRGVDLTELIRESCNDLLPEIKAKHQLLTLQLAKGFSFVFGDPNRLKQIFMNLLTNAHQYTPAEGHLQVRTRVEGHQVCVEVQDTGEALSSEELAHIFTRFFRAESHRTGTISGAGLGLSITRALVEMHGGSIAATSTPGQGSTFRVVLPAYEEMGRGTWNL